MPRSLQLLADRARLADLRQKRAALVRRCPWPIRRRSAARPARRAIRRPVLSRRSCRRAVSGRRRMESMLTCGIEEKQIDAVEPRAVRRGPRPSGSASCRDRSAAPRPVPLPTRPGHIALCSAGNFGCEAMDASVFQRDPERVQLIVVGDEVNLPAAGGQPAARERRDLRSAVPHASCPSRRRARTGRPARTSGRAAQPTATPVRRGIRRSRPRRPCRPPQSARAAT